MSTAAKGARRERQSRVLLEREGYAVTRAAGSKGCFDLIGIRHDGIVLAQIKCNRPPGPAERAAMLAIEVPQNAVRLIHVWRDGEGTPEVIELGATRCGTRSPRMTRCRLRK